MPDYTLAVGPHDPVGFSAGNDAEAVRTAVNLVVRDYRDLLTDVPQEVATLMGPGGLITGASERLDAFVRRAGSDAAEAGDTARTLQPGDTDTPDCNAG